MSLDSKQIGYRTDNRAMNSTFVIQLIMEYVIVYNLNIIQNDQIMKFYLKLNNKYLVDETELLGTGAFSKVYTAKNINTGQPLAVKAIRKRTEPHFYENALNQIQILKLLNHKNIVQIREVIDQTDLLYVVMEYCYGLTLDKYLKQNTSISEKQALLIFDQLLEAINHILKNNVLHRDLKPANIIYNQGNVKLLDFGFAAVFQELHQQIPDQMGTPLYMSPQLLSKQPYTTKSDVWSLGIILFQMIYGHTPWKAKNPNQLLRMMITYPLQFPAFPIISLNTKLLIKDCLKVEESSRIGWDKLLQRINTKSLRKCKSKIQLVSKKYYSPQVKCNYFFC